MSARRVLALALLAGVACSGAGPGERPPPRLAAGEAESRAREALDQGRDADALALVEKARELVDLGRPADPLAAWRVRALEAEIRRARGERDRALGLLAPAPDGVPRHLRARALLTEALARCQLGHDAGEVDALFAAAARLSDGADDTALRLDLHRCSCAVTRRDYAAAERFARRALEAARARGLEFFAASAAGNLGVVRMQTERYDDAVDWLSRVLDYARTSGNSQMEVKTLLNLAICDLMLAESGRALERLNAGISRARAGAHVGELPKLLLHAGIAEQALGRRSAAERRFREALALAQGDAGIEAQALNHEAELALARGRTADAERLAHEALRRGAPVVETHHAHLLLGEAGARRGAHEEAEKLLRAVAGAPTAERNQRWRAQAALASLFAGRGRDAEAEAQFVGALATVEEGRDELRASETRIAFVAAVRRFQDDYVDFLADRGRAAEALEVSDRSRARQLLDGGARGARRLSDFQRVARRWDASLVSYWLSARRGYAWAVDGEELHALALLASRDEVCRLVGEYQALLLDAQDPRREGRRVGQRLYELLVAPVVARLARRERLVLVLDGCLNVLNFETLMPTDQRFFLEDATLVVAPSLGALAADGEVSAARPGGDARALLIGAPLAAPRFPELPQAQREMREVAELFSPGRVQVLNGAAARPDAYAAARPERFAYIHFAAHATASRDSPLDSAVILSPDGDDYKLHARDIVQVPLGAELVTLSACHGAGARDYAGEGLVGLAWAFLKAGARNVVAGLWSVEDNSTAELMRHLYGGLRAGRAPADALRAAKLRLLRSPGAYRKPFYWAPFQVYTRAPSGAAPPP